MHAWVVVDLRVYLTKKNHGYSISAQRYDFCPHLIQLDILDFTLSHIEKKDINPFCFIKKNQFDLVEFEKIKI